MGAGVPTTIPGNSGLAAVIICVLGVGHSTDARAQPAPAGEPPARLTSTASLDGLYAAVGPVGSLVRVDTTWDGGFGAELTFVRVRERRPLAALGLSLGGMRFAELGGGRLWADVLVGTRKPLGIAVGVTAGAVAQVDPVLPPRWGAQTSVWVFAGVIPYIRVGAVQRSGLFFDVGLRVALPALRL